MYPGQFDYHSADTVGEAQQLLADHGDRDAQLLAGGQGLVPSMKVGEASPDVLVDVRGLDELAGIAVDDAGATVGALATHREVADHDGLADVAPVLPATAAHTADRQVRNRGTLGGNLAEADPAADPPAAVLAADATVQIRGPDGERHVDASAFFRGDGETALDERDVLTAVRVTRHDAAGYAKKTHPATGYAMVGVAAVLRTADGTIESAGVAATGLLDRPARLDHVEEVLAGESAVGDPAAVDELAAEAAGTATADVDDDRLVGDEHASAQFRRGILPTYVGRAVGTALSDLAGGDDDE